MAIPTSRATRRPLEAKPRAHTSAVERRAIAFRKILVGTDLSDASKPALAYAQALARRFNAELFLAHVLPHEIGPAQPHEPCQPEAQLAEEMLQAALRAPSFAGLHAQSAVLRGDIADALQQFSRKHRIDVVIVGTHARGRLPKLLLGSFAEEVFRELQIPVITVGPHVVTDAEGQAHLRRLLFATDLSQVSLAALPYACKLARALGVQLTIAHFVHPDVRSLAERTRLRKSYEERMARELAKIGPRPIAVVRIAFAQPAKGTLQLAASQKADLIILGVRGGGFDPLLASHVPGPTAYRIAAGATCPVMTLRSGAR